MGCPIFWGISDASATAPPLSEKSIALSIGLRTIAISSVEKAPGICSDAITRVPFIWRWKGHFHLGHIVNEVVELVDVAPTLCSLCGIDPMETSDGHDLSKMLAGGKGDPERVGVTECPWSKSIRYGKYRLVYYPREMFADEYSEGFGELYDLEADPWEMRNLYFEPEYEDLVKGLDERLLHWLITTTPPTTVWPMPLLEGWQFRTRFGANVNFDNKISPRLLLTRLRTVNYL